MILRTAIPPRVGPSVIWTSVFSNRALPARMCHKIITEMAADAPKSPVEANIPLPNAAVDQLGRRLTGAAGRRARDASGTCPGTPFDKLGTGGLRRCGIADADHTDAQLAWRHAERLAYGGNPVGRNSK